MVRSEKLVTCKAGLWEAPRGGQENEAMLSGAGVGQSTPSEEKHTFTHEGLLGQGTPA